MLADALEASLGPREDRDADARLFPERQRRPAPHSDSAGVQSAGCRCSQPHDLRHRRIWLLHRQGRSWAEIARFVGQRKLSITADTYSHVMSDGEEVDYREMLRMTGSVSLTRLRILDSSGD